MTSQMTTKVRLVRCPRCRQVLPELAEVPVYKCGGCGTVLQAKNRKNGTKDSGSHLCETDPTQKNELEHVSEGKEASNLNQEATFSSIGESALGKSNERDQNEFGECNRGQPGVRNFSDELPSSTELTGHENEESSPEARADMELDEDRCPSDQYNRDEFGDCSGELPGRNFSDELPSSTELTGHKNEESSPEARADMESDEDRCPLDQYNRDEFGDCSGELPGRNFSDELPCSTELIGHENEELSPDARADMESDEGRCTSDQYNQDEFGDCNGELPGRNFSDEVSSSAELNHNENESSLPGAGTHTEVDESKYSLEQNTGKDQNESGYCNGEWSGNVKFPKEVPSSTELTCHEIEEPSPVAGADTEVYENFKSRFVFRSSSAENFLASRPRDSIISSRRPLGESILSDDLTSPYNVQLEQSKSIHQVFNRVTSVDTLENIPVVNPSSDLSVTLGDMSKSPTTRSYYAYDGSVSSYDGTDDQVPDRHHLHLSKRNFKDADFISTKGLPRRDECMVNNMMISESEMQHQAMNSSSISPGKKHHAVRRSKWHQDELQEPTRHDHLVRSRMRLERDERLSRLPLYSRDSQAGQRNGSPSSHGHSEFRYSSSFLSPDKPEYPEPDKMELLRMVYELQDQLNRTYVSKGKADGRFPAGAARKEKQIPSYYSPLAPEAEIYPDLNYSRYPGSYGQGKSWPQQCKLSRMAFSGEATYSRHQVDCSCLHCYPKDWHCSAQLPSHVICCNKGQYTVHPSHNCYNPCRSSPSSPQHCEGSDVSLWSRDTKSDDQRHKDREVKNFYLRERPHSMKRHFRPIEGGAPIIACYRCLELLQLPADFLLFKRRSHQLRCSSCSEVLKFSLQNRIHLVPYIPDAIAPPPSEADDYGDAINGRNLASTSHANYRAHAEPVSCSDDYGQSFCKSCSTEGENFSLTPPFHALAKDSNHRNMSSGSSFEPMEERKKPVLKVSQNKYKNPVETFESPGRSSKMSKWEKLSSEIEELPPTGGSPLHRLMGYSSPSEVINR